MALDLRRGDDVRKLDRALGIDHVGDAPRIVDVGVVGRPLRVVLLPGDVLGVGEQQEREVVGVGERQVLLGSVERDAEDRRAQVFEFRGSVTEPATLDRSAGGGGLRVPPQHDPLLPVVGQAHRLSVLIDGVDGGCFGSGKQHGGRA